MGWRSEEESGGVRRRSQEEEWGGGGVRRRRNEKEEWGGGGVRRRIWGDENCEERNNGSGEQLRKKQSQQLRKNQSHQLRKKAAVSRCTFTGREAVILQVATLLHWTMDIRLSCTEYYFTEHWHYTVSALWREEGFTVKYSLSPCKLPPPKRSLPPL